VQVRLTTAQQQLQGDVDVVLQVSVTNTNRHPVQLLQRQLPSDELAGALFTIFRDGQRVAYTGPLVKRKAPQADEHVRLAAGATLSYTVELTQAYDLSRNGRYSVEYQSRAGHGLGLPALKSEPLYLWLEGRSERVQASALPSITPSASSISYTGNCKASQKKTLANAVTAATNYSTESASYLSGAGSGTARYVKWFGAYSSSRWNTVASNFAKARDAFKGAALTLDCSCKTRNTYAYVYPSQPYKIYVCGAFWNAPMTGTDSKAGTLVHEMMHFNVIAGTDDWAYGQTAAANLAISDPNKAVDNSDNHEYFAENNPSLP
jgi:peptidyl-Lys metalloendopeptidase